MEKQTHRKSSQSINDLAGADEKLRKCAQVVFEIYQRIKHTPAGEKLPLKSQWRKRFEEKNDGDVSHKEQVRKCDDLRGIELIQLLSKRGSPPGEFVL